MTQQRNRAAGTHSALAGLPSQDGVLLIGGRLVTDIAAVVGTTPFYVYDRSAMAARMKKLREHLPQDLHVHYAIKANPNPGVVAFMAGLVDGFDVASHGEMRVALDAGMQADRISLAGPGKRTAEIHSAVAAEITIHVESERELREVAAAAAPGRERPRVVIRVNPDFQLRSSGMKMGGGAQQFGIDAELVPAILRNFDSKRLQFEGFHIFGGSQNLDWEAIAEAQSGTIALAERLAEDAPGAVRTLNIGGGFGIPYFPGEQPLELARVGENLKGLASRVRKSLPQARLILELGRYLVGEAGFYVCRVLDRKISRGRVFLVTDGGLHHHLAASGNFGQVIRKNYPVLIGNRLNETATEEASVVGPLCTPLDLLADKLQFPVAREGDYVVILQSGAYGFSASPHRFLSHPEPAEILI